MSFLANAKSQELLFFVHSHQQFPIYLVYCVIQNQWYKNLFDLCFNFYYVLKVFLKIYYLQHPHCGRDADRTAHLYSECVRSCQTWIERGSETEKK